MFKQVFLPFSVADEEIKKKKCIKIPIKGVYQHLVGTLKPWLTLKRWSSPGENVIFYDKITFCPGVYQRFDVNQHLKYQLNMGRPPFHKYFLFVFHTFSSFSCL